jgi:hypothetical protein
MERMEDHSYPVLFDIGRSEIKEAYKRAGWREANYLPGRGESMISEVDGLGQLSPLHVGHGSLSVFQREACTSSFVAAGLAFARPFPNSEGNRKLIRISILNSGSLVRRWLHSMAGDSWHSSKIIRADEKTQESSK